MKNSTKARMIVRMYERFGKNYDDISEITGISYNHVQKVIQSANYYHTKIKEGKGKKLFYDSKDYKYLKKYKISKKVKNKYL